jgi:hypothetical protein
MVSLATTLKDYDFRGGVVRTTVGAELSGTEQHLFPVKSKRQLLQP